MDVLALHAQSPSYDQWDRHMKCTMQRALRLPGQYLPLAARRRHLHDTLSKRQDCPTASPSIRPAPAAGIRATRRIAARSRSPQRMASTFPASARGRSARRFRDLRSDPCHGPQAISTSLPRICAATPRAQHPPVSATMRSARREDVPDPYYRRRGRISRPSTACS